MGKVVSIRRKVHGRLRAGRPPKAPIGTLGMAFREARVRKGWSLVEAGKISGVPYNRISEYERGIRRPSPETLAKIYATYPDLDSIIEDMREFW